MTKVSINLPCGGVLICIGERNLKISRQHLAITWIKAGLRKKGLYDCLSIFFSGAECGLMGRKSDSL